MSKRPSFQFYPADWRSNANLRRCSPSARGAWMDIMCVLHDSDEYGIVRWPLKELAQAAGVIYGLAKELAAKCVLKGSDTRLTEPYVYTPRSGRKDGEPVTLVPTQDGPVWFSSRMVKDEYVRTIRGEPSRFGEANDEAPKPSPKPPIGDGSSTAASSSASPSSLRSDVSRARAKSVSRGFAEFWDAYPKRVSKGAAEKAFAKAEAKTPAEEIIAGAKRYALSREDEDPQFTKNPATWLNAECWLDEVPNGPATRSNVVKDSLGAARQALDEIERAKARRHGGDTKPGVDDDDPEPGLGFSPSTGNGSGNHHTSHDAGRVFPLAADDPSRSEPEIPSFLLRSPRVS